MCQTLKYFVKRPECALKKSPLMTKSRLARKSETAVHTKPPDYQIEGKDHEIPRCELCMESSLF